MVPVDVIIKAVKKKVVEMGKLTRKSSRVICDIIHLKRFHLGIKILYLKGNYELTIILTTVMMQY